MKKTTEICKKETRLSTTAAQKGSDWGPCLKFKSEKNKTTGNPEIKAIHLTDGSPAIKENSEKFREVLKKTTGTENPDFGLNILDHVAHGLKQTERAERLDQAARMLPALKPQDETEALLSGQFLALQEAGMRCLRQGNAQEGFYHIERYLLLASKMFNTANQTMQTLLKYRSGGQQVVQVVHLHNEGGKAIVAQNLSQPLSAEGVQGKTEN